jgi:regulator of protease activity HflC (stomatin/prohibitin superfamily)
MDNLGCCKVRIVEQSTIGLVETWGKFSRVIEPGCYCIGFGETLRGLMSLRIEQLNVRCQTKTKVCAHAMLSLSSSLFLPLFTHSSPRPSSVQDNVFVTLVASIQYRTVKDKVADAFYTLYNPHRQIEAFVDDGADICMQNGTLHSPSTDSACASHSAERRCPNAESG